MRWKLMPALACMLVSGTAMAADLPIDPPTHDWTGFYLGATGSYLFGDVHGDAGCCSDDFDIDGFQLGGIGGYNFAFGGFIAGVEADLAMLDVDGKGFGGGIDDFDVSPTAHLRGRIGLPTQRALIFLATGLTAADGDARNPGNGVPSQWHLGWNAGAGVDFALTDHIAVRAEYIFDQLFEETYSYPAGDIDFDWTSSTVRAAVIWNF